MDAIFSKFWLFVLLLSILILSACAKDKPGDIPTKSAPTVTTNSISEITSTSAKSGGNVTSDGGATVTSRGVCWGTDQNPTISGAKTTDGSGSGSFVSQISGLSPGVTYYIRAYAVNSAGTSYGSQLSFSTGASAPTVTTSTVADITTGTASGGGSVTSDGGGAVSARGVCWSTSQNPTILDNKSSDGTGSGNFSSTIFGLEPNSTYYVRAYATNSAGTSYGSSSSFTTKTTETLVGAEQMFPSSAGNTSAITLDGVSVTCEVINGFYIYQGDIILAAPQAQGVATKGAALNIQTRHWPDNRIYYNINQSLPDPTRVTQAINAIVQVSNLEFIQRTGESNYIDFVFDHTGCSSFLGMVGGRQDIRLANWATMGNVIHEICHALGMLHEHSKSGRNNFITVVSSNIIERYAHNFAEFTKSINTPINPEAFDFQSIMLYSSTSFSKNNNPTITKKDGSTWAVQRQFLSTSDIEMINTLYPPIAVTMRDADNNVYETVTIGSQIWMDENLRVTRYKDRTSITMNSSDAGWSNSTTGSFCWYGNSEANKTVYGALYNWNAVNSGKLCPDGWRVPTDADWTIMTDFIGGLIGNSGKLKSTGTALWAAPNTGATNSTGFSAKPGGYRYFTGAFGGQGYGADWWSSTEASADKSWVYGVNYNSNNITRYNDFKRNGFAVRCIKE
ncbi:MAG: FISUMP domain-containing protein [Bacteroidales bacterium]|nr:FISUMP domain-containing protein [Bacteroidales bacterium]